ncbi:MAG: hypothetical protein KGI25_06570 [Thaumarchaeota archaeon]|nr:hypothetical protein [Nitrososphaerota archaeon]
MGRADLVAFPRALPVRLMEGYPEKQVIALTDYVSKDIMVNIMSVL